jgi:hypothetical protein
LKKKYSFGNFKSAGPADFASGPNGGVVSTGTQCLGVDFSGASGAPALIALVGIDAPKADNILAVTPAGKVTIVTMQSGKAPEVKADGDKITVGGQTVTWDGRRVVFGK